ncbi:MAG: flagellar biosynthetic protein FliO [candidate division Zixibacteria bacterium]|nr:flagellar biosynthetic protein FliO [candidate division Zixibacteria bacterium]
MAQNNSQRRRSIATAIILAVALIGMLLITSNRPASSGILYAQPESQTAVSTDTVEVAATTSTTTAPAYQPMISTSTATSSIIKMITALAVVVVCIYVGIWLLKKLTSRRYSNGRKALMLEVLETAYIDPKKSLSLVRVADRSVLIGVTDNQISVLTELDTELTKAAMEAASKGTQGESFSTMLKSATQKFAGFGK